MSFTLRQPIGHYLDMQREVGQDGMSMQPHIRKPPASGMEYGLRVEGLAMGGSVRSGTRPGERTSE